MKGIDAAFDLSPHAGDLIAAGVGFVCRYYSYNAAKDLSPDEAQTLSAAGLLIVSVWEARGDVASNFTPAQGQKDANAALLLAESCGQPEGSCIYFAVDFDASDSDLTHNILPYFQAVGGVLHGKYTVGAYGSGLVLCRLHNASLIDRRWLAQSRGWRDTAEFVGADIVQGPVDHSLLCDPVDTDESQDDEFGGWRVGGKEVVQAGQHTDQHKPIVAQPSEADVAATITTLQRQLAALGFYKGKIDSIAGPQTNAALIAWENDG